MSIYESLLTELSADADTVYLDARRLAWSVARTTKAAAERTTTARVKAMKDENEAFRRMPHDEHTRVFAQVLAEELSARQRSAGVARRRVESKLADLDQRRARYIQRRRHDVSISFPQALDGLDAAGMIQFELLREMLRPAIANASAADLLATYERAMTSKSARGLIEAGLVEERVRRGGISRRDEDVAVVKRLAEYVDGVQELRVEPVAPLHDIAEVIEFASKAIGRADLVHVRPVDESRDVEAREAFESEADEYALALVEAAATAKAAGQ